MSLRSNRIETISSCVGWGRATHSNDHRTAALPDVDVGSHVGVVPTAAVQNCVQSDRPTAASANAISRATTATATSAKHCDVCNNVARIVGDSTMRVNVRSRGGAAVSVTVAVHRRRSRLSVASRRRELLYFPH
ncbi:hypothetical protein EVAR_29366_1 [Eumeta japonica]|uniref:Uncharacterized protein n=1 Tax=Eumeta variegata TaxID=151549 RepID=A0A4C1WKD0_EUMVA|nr:hypothetical protein EVAR_29366_1 [Eumeta japonica]